MARCDDCKFYYPLYEKGDNAFFITYYGKCHKKGRIMLRSRSCGCFQQMPEPKNKFKAIFERLDIALDDVSAIKQLLEEKLKKPSD